MLLAQRPRDGDELLHRVVGDWMMPELRKSPSM
jgi:hypothetical protein